MVPESKLEEASKDIKKWTYSNRPDMVEGTCEDYPLDDGNKVEYDGPFERSLFFINKISNYSL